MSDKMVIVKVIEEESEDSYLKVFIPSHIPEEKFKKDYEMGTKYAQVAFFEDDRSKFDECFEAMADIRENINGEQAFITYMEMRGYEVEPLIPDYEFEW